MAKQGCNFSHLYITAGSLTCCVKNGDDSHHSGHNSNFPPLPGDLLPYLFSIPFSSLLSSPSFFPCLLLTCVLLIFSLFLACFLAFNSALIFFSSLYSFFSSFLSFSHCLALSFSCFLLFLCILSAGVTEPSTPLCISLVKVLMV